MGSFDCVRRYYRNEEIKKAEVDVSNRVGNLVLTSSHVSITFFLNMRPLVPPLHQGRGFLEYVTLVSRPYSIEFHTRITVQSVCLSVGPVTLTFRDIWFFF